MREKEIPLITSCLPNSSQQLLLQTCLLPDAKAIEVFGAWSALPRAKRNDPASQRLFPLLWWRFHGWNQALAIPLASEECATWKQAMLRTWALNQRRLSQANQIAEQLGNIGVPLLVVKGLPLALSAYGHLGLRPMGDLDLVVPASKANEAIKALTTAGWTALPTPLKGSDAPGADSLHPWIHRNRPLAAFDELYFRVRNGHGFRLSDGSETDLHWYVFHEHCNPGSDDALWHAAECLEQRNRSTTTGVSPLLRLPDPADHLLLVLSHASRWESVAPIRWVADAVLLLQTATAFNWNRFVDVAKDRNLSSQIIPMLTYIEQQMGVVLPADILTSLAVTSRGNRAQFPSTRSTPDARGGGEELIYLLQRWRTLRRDPTLNIEVPGFPTFLCHILGSPTRRALLRYAFSEQRRRRRPEQSIS